MSTLPYPVESPHYLLRKASCPRAPCGPSCPALPLSPRQSQFWLHPLAKFQGHDVPSICPAHCGRSKAKLCGDAHSGQGSGAAGGAVPLGSGPFCPHPREGGGESQHQETAYLQLERKTLCRKAEELHYAQIWDGFQEDRWEAVCLLHYNRTATNMPGAFGLCDQEQRGTASEFREGGGYRPGHCRTRHTASEGW